MNSDRLLAHFDLVADAPDAIEHLRSFVLDLAMRGKLVPQDPTDEPASQLLKRLATERKRQADAGDIRAVETIFVQPDDVPFVVPITWTWTRLGEIGNWGSGSTPQRGAADLYGDGIAWLKSGELNDNRMLSGSEERITELALAKGSFRRNRPGDVLFAMYGATIGKVAILAEEAVTNQAVCGCTPFTGVFNQFLYLFLLSQRKQFRAASEGGAQPNLSKVKIVRTPFPLPPVAEQHRIVAKVDELMTLCDRLHLARSGREAIRSRLTSAGFARLSEADSRTFDDDVRFVLNTIPKLTARQYQLEKVRQAMFRLAVRGRLVPPDPNEESAVQYLKRLGIPSSAPGPYVIPASWAWVSVGAVAEARLGKMLDKSKNKGNPQRYLRNVNVRWFDFDLSNLFEMRFEDSELSEFSLRSGDVLVCEGGEPGRAAVWDERQAEIYFQKAIHRVRFCEGVNSHYFVKALRASADDGRLAAYFTGVGIKHLTGKGLNGYLFPLPPIGEQQRIVTKVNELMTLCDAIEAGLTTVEQTRSVLLQVLLHETLTSSGHNGE